MRVLVAGRHATLLAALARTFANDLKIAIATTLAQGLGLLEDQEFDVVFACENLGGGSGLQILSHVAVNSPDTLRIFAARPATLHLLKGELGLFGLFRTLNYPIDARKLAGALKLARGCLETEAEPLTVRHVVLEDEWETHPWKIDFAELELAAGAPPRPFEWMPPNDADDDGATFGVPTIQADPADGGNVPGAADLAHATDAADLAHVADAADVADAAQATDLAETSAVSVASAARAPSGPSASSMQSVASVASAASVTPAASAASAASVTSVASAASAAPVTSVASAASAASVAFVASAATAAAAASASAPASLSPPRSPAQSAVYQRALARRNAAKLEVMTGVFAPTSTSTSTSTSPLQSSAEPAAAAAAAIPSDRNLRSQRTASERSLVKLAELMSRPGPPAGPRKPKKPAKRTALFIGSAVAAGLGVAVAALILLNTGRSMANTRSPTSASTQRLVSGGGDLSWQQNIQSSNPDAINDGATRFQESNPGTSLGRPASSSGPTFIPAVSPAADTPVNASASQSPDEPAPGARAEFLQPPDSYEAAGRQPGPPPGYSQPGPAFFQPGPPPAYAPPGPSEPPSSSAFAGQPESALPQSEPP